ncbi:MAG: [protein-PII] uridylyltransferase [Acidimicrobiales bacterium]
MKANTPLLVDRQRRGRDYAQAHSDATDEWFRTLYDSTLGSTDGLALVAVGGYGRRELCPYSDIDVLLVHDHVDDYADAAEALWYPVWDRGLKMGYAVVTIEQAHTLAAEELHWATAFLAARLVAGDSALVERLERTTADVWRQGGPDLLGQLAQSVHERHDRFGDAAFQIEPHLKEGRGGLRDVHALGWATVVSPDFAEGLVGDLATEAETLLEARVELHRLMGRPGDILTLDAQDDVAAALDVSVHELMVQLAQASRRIAWSSDEAWSTWERRTGRVGRATEIGYPIPTEFGLVDGRIELTATVDPGADPVAVLRLATTAAKASRTIGRASLQRIADTGSPLPDPWPAEAREFFVELLLAGRSAIGVIEDLDQFEIMSMILPEWQAVRCRPQRNAMHTFTVDRHLCEAAANAAALVDRVTRPDLLVVGALFHDIGKGFPGDHTEVGIEVIGRMASRMGYPDDEVGVLVDLCRHHLLLPDVATRRDLSDPGTISAVAAAVDSVDFLTTLAALTEADSIATGPSAWGTWKAGLLADLVDRTAYVLDGGALAEVAVSDFPTPELITAMAAGERVLQGKDTTFTVVAKDEPGLISRIAGVLALSGYDVLDAMAHSGDRTAACEFTLQPPTSGTVDWDRVIDNAERALDGRMALTARVRQRARDYDRYRRRLSASPPRHDVVIDNTISDVATVVEVHASDTVGLLFWITQALGELRLTIRSAKIQTFGPQAVDSFYVCDAAGTKLDDDHELLRELDLAVREAVGRQPDIS